MNAQGGWTLIELVLVLILLGILSSFVLRTGSSTQEFDEFVFVRSLSSSFNQAKTFTYYSKIPVTVTSNNDTLSFAAQTLNKTYHWSVKNFDLASFDESMFPIVIKPYVTQISSTQKSLVFSTPHYLVSMDVNTGLTSWESRHD